MIGLTCSFAEALRSLRSAAGLTQEDLAVRSGVSARQIRRLEAGIHPAPRRSTVRLLGLSLGLNEYRLLQLMKLAHPEVELWDERESDQRGPSIIDAKRSPGRPIRSSAIPAALTTLVGRDAVIERIGARLMGSHSRLITITGPPGIGKTRVALEVARRLDGELTGGARVVWFAPLREASLVPAQIAQTVARDLEPSTVSVDELCRIIGEEAQLLVLDNMEHVIQSAPLIPELLQRCPELRILTTSRVRLNVSGENLESLPPLTVPCNRSRQTERPPVRTESEELFLLRARAVDPLLQTTEATDQLIAEICRRVDGVPLAIELAAARFGRQTLDEVEAHIDRLLPILVDGPVDQPERLQTMMKSLDWSYSLLTIEEQRLLRLLSIFPGGADLAALGAVFPEPLAELSLAELLDRLVGQHLVVRHRTRADRVRFRLLELTREFGSQLLRERNEAAAARQRQASYYLTLAERYEQRHWLPDGIPLPAKLADDLPNLWEVLRWLDESADGAGLLRLTGSLHSIWTAGGYLREGQRWLQRALEIGWDGPPKERSKCRVSLGHLYFYMGDLDRAAEEYIVALREANEAGDPVQRTWASTAFGALEISRGNYLVGKALSEQALAAAACADDHDRELADAIASWVPGALGRAEHGLGNFAQADEWFRLGVKQMEARRQRRGAARVLEAWGTLAVDQGATAAALDRYLRSMAWADESGDDAWVAVCLPMAARVLEKLTLRREAIHLLGAADSWRRESGQTASFSPMNARVADEAERLLRASVPVAEFEEAWRAGARFSMRDSLAFLRSVSAHPTSQPRDGRPTDSVTIL